MQKADCKHILDVRCYMHAFSNAMGSLICLPTIKSLVLKCQGIVSFFNASHRALDQFRKIADSMEIVGGGLVTSNATRLTSTYLCVNSVRRNQRVLRSFKNREGREMITNNSVYQSIADDEFWHEIEILHSLVYPFASVIDTLQGRQSKLVDVARYWTHLISSRTVFFDWHIVVDPARRVRKISKRSELVGRHRHCCERKNPTDPL